MPRDFDLDPDSARLPEGMTRVGYDADTQEYSYRDTAGQYYTGSPGARYGLLRPTGRSQHPPWYSPSSWAMNRAHANDTREAWRYLLPFILLCFLFLLCVFWFLSPESVSCGEGSQKYVVQAGDTCFEIAKKFGTTVDELMKDNGWTDKDCRTLSIDKVMCVPNLGGKGA